MEKYTAPNTAKICKIELINFASVDEMKTDQLLHETELVLLPGKSFTQIVFTEESATINVVEEGDDDGSLPYRRVAVEFQAPKVTGLRNASLENWKRQMLICRVTDMHGQIFVIGTIKSPATLTYASTISGKAAESNSFTVTITGYSNIGLLQHKVV